MRIPGLSRPSEILIDLIHLCIDFSLMKRKKFKCPCCDYYTLNIPLGNTFQLCEVCYWEDDGIQLADKDYTGGANRVSLNQARKNYAQYGASELRFIELVREPKQSEK